MWIWLSGVLKGASRMWGLVKREKNEKGLDPYEYQFKNAESFRAWQAEQIRHDVRKAVAASAARHY